MLPAGETSGFIFTYSAFSHFYVYSFTLVYINQTEASEPGFVSYSSGLRSQQFIHCQYIHTRSPLWAEMWVFLNSSDN